MRNEFLRTRISSDSTCDLSKDLLARGEISIVPLYISLGEKTYLDGVGTTPDMLYRYFNETGELPKTAAPSPDNFYDKFNELTADGAGLVHISISSELSASYNNACIAAKRLKNVFVVDSRNLSTGIGLLVLRGAEMAKAGCSAEEIYQKLNADASLVEASFVIDTLTYLHKGGRCSSVAALGSNLLKIKPCIEVDDGCMRLGKKYRGPLKRCIESYISDRLSDRSDIDPRRIFLTHTAGDSEIVDAALAAINASHAFDEVLVTSAGSTIASHCGPGTLGILFFRKGPTSAIE